MNDSIFSPSFGNRPDTLVGRSAIKNRILSALQSRPGSRERSTLILGQRGSGKTVLLLEIADLAREHKVLTASPTIVSANLFRRILEKLVLSSDMTGEKMPVVTGAGVSILGFGGNIQMERFDNPQNLSFAARVSRLVRDVNNQGKPVLILVDEVQAGNEELRQLVIAYQEMVGEGLDVMLVMAGLPVAVSSLLNDKVLTFLNRASKLYLTPLSIGEVDAYYARCFEKLGIDLPENQRLQAASETQGSPYLMQLIGHYIVAYCDEEGKITDALFQNAIKTAKDEFMNDVCKTTLDVLSGRDVAFLEAMASEDSSEVPISKIVDKMQISSQYAQNYRRRLIQAGVIEQVRRGTMRFAVPFLRDYLRQLQEE